MTTGFTKASHQQLGRVARGGAINLVGAVVNAATNFVLVVIITRYFTETTAGLLFSASSTFLILVSTGSLGVDTGLARFILRYEATGRQGDILRMVRVAAIPVALVSAVLTALLVIGAGPVARMTGLGSGNGVEMIRVLGAMIPFAAISAFALAVTAAVGKMRPTALIENILRSVVQVCAVIAVAVTGGGAFALTLAWGLPYALAAAIAILTAYRIMARRRRRWPETERSPGRVVRREFWLYTWPRGISRFCQIAIQRADIVLIGMLLGPKDAAVYTAATRFVALGQFAVQAIQRVLQPRFSQLLARKELDVTRDVFKISTAWSICLSFPLYLTAASAAPIYLQIFGSGYRSAGSSVVVVMAIGMMLGIAAGPLDTLLLMAGRSTASLVNALVALAVDIALCLVLIPRIGILGAAIAWAAAVVVRNAMTFVQVYRILQITPFSRAGLIATVASLGLFAGPLLLMQRFVPLTIGSFMITTLLGGTAFIGALWLSREPLALTALRALVERPSKKHEPVSAGAEL